MAGEFRTFPVPDRIERVFTALGQLLLRTVREVLHLAQEGFKRLHITKDLLQSCFREASEKEDPRGILQEKNIHSFSFAFFRRFVITSSSNVPIGGRLETKLDNAGFGKNNSTRLVKRQKWLDDFFQSKLVSELCSNSMHRLRQEVTNIFEGVLNELFVAFTGKNFDRLRPFSRVTGDFASASVYITLNDFNTEMFLKYTTPPRNSILVDSRFVVNGQYLLYQKWNQTLANNSPIEGKGIRVVYPRKSVAIDISDGATAGATAGDAKSEEPKPKEQARLMYVFKKGLSEEEVATETALTLSADYESIKGLGMLSVVRSMLVPLLEGQMYTMVPANNLKFARKYVEKINGEIDAGKDPTIVGVDPGQGSAHMVTLSPGFTKAIVLGEGLPLGYKDEVLATNHLHLAQYNRTRLHGNSNYGGFLKAQGINSERKCRMILDMKELADELRSEQNAVAIFIGDYNATGGEQVRKNSQGQSGTCWADLLKHLMLSCAEKGMFAKVTNESYTSQGRFHSSLNGGGSQATALSNMYSFDPWARHQGRKHTPFGKEGFVRQVLTAQEKKYRAIEGTLSASFSNQLAYQMKKKPNPKNTSSDENVEAANRASITAGHGTELFVCSVMKGAEGFEHVKRPPKAVNDVLKLSGTADCIALAPDERFDGNSSSASSQSRKVPIVIEVKFTIQNLYSLLPGWVVQVSIYLKLYGGEIGYIIVKTGQYGRFGFSKGWKVFTVKLHPSMSAAIDSTAHLDNQNRARTLLSIAMEIAPYGSAGVEDVTDDHNHAVARAMASKAARDNRQFTLINAAIGASLKKVGVGNDPLLPPQQNLRRFMGPIRGVKAIRDGNQHVTVGRDLSSAQTIAVKGNNELLQVYGGDMVKLGLKEVSEAGREQKRGKDFILTRDLLAEKVSIAGGTNNHLPIARKVVHELAMHYCEDTLRRGGFVLTKTPFEHKGEEHGHEDRVSAADHMRTPEAMPFGYNYTLCFKCALTGIQSVNTHGGRCAKMRATAEETVLTFGKQWSESQKTHYKKFFGDYETIHKAAVGPQYKKFTVANMSHLRSTLPSNRQEHWHCLQNLDDSDGSDQSDSDSDDDDDSYASDPPPAGEDDSLPVSDDNQLDIEGNPDDAMVVDNDFTHSNLCRVCELAGRNTAGTAQPQKENHRGKCFEFQLTAKELYNRDNQGTGSSSSGSRKRKRASVIYENLSEEESQKYEFESKQLREQYDMAVLEKRLPSIFSKFAKAARVHFNGATKKEGKRGGDDAPVAARTRGGKAA